VLDDKTGAEWFAGNLTLRSGGTPLCSGMETDANERVKAWSHPRKRQ